jgi:hypothetical protein
VVSRAAAPIFKTDMLVGLEKYFIVFPLRYFFSQGPALYGRRGDLKDSQGF